MFAMDVNLEVTEKKKDGLIARKANKSYKELKITCRKGVNLTEEVYNINKVVTPL